MKITPAILFATTFASLLRNNARADVVYTMPEAILVDETWNYAPPGLSLSRGASASGSLYFKYTVANPASNFTSESYYAGLSFFDGTNEHLGVGNGWNPWAYSAFSGGLPGGNLDLKSATSEPGQNYQLVRATDMTTIVIRVDFNSGADDNITVWLNPNLALSESAQNPSLTTTFTANADFDRIYLREGGGGAGWNFSEFVIAEKGNDLGFFATPTNTATWDAGGVDNNWSSAANWLGDAAPVAGFDLIFPDSGNTSPVNDLSVGTNFVGLTFPNGAMPYLISGNGISLTNFIRNNSSNGQTVHLPIELSGPLSIDALNSNIRVESSISGPHGISKTGANLVELTAHNTYTGNTNITTGTLSIGNGDVVGSLDPTGSIIFGEGTNTRLYIDRTDTMILGNAIQTAGRAHIAAVGEGTVVISGAVTGEGEFWTYGPGIVKITPNEGSASYTPTVVNSYGILEVDDFSSNTLGTGAFCIAQGGSGTLRYTGPSASTGRVAGYALQGTTTNSFIDVSNPSTELILTQPLGDNGPGKGLTKIGSGRLVFAAAQTYSGDTIIEEGELALTQAGFIDSSTIIINQGALLDLDFIGVDTISGLILGNDVMGPGTYTNASHPDFITGTGSLVIPSTDPFPTWIASFTSAPGADLTKTGDADGDGMSNLLEFALDGDPTNGNASGKVMEKIDNGFLTLTTPVRLGATFTGTGPLVATVSVDGLTYEIEGSNDLSSFAAGVSELAVPISAELPDLNVGWEYRSFRLSIPTSSANKGFLRCNITPTP